MKHLKRWLSYLLVLCMTMSMLPLSVLADETNDSRQLSMDSNSNIEADVHNSITKSIIAQGSWNGNKYIVMDLSLTWTDAMKYCQKLGGHLVTITSADEQKFIESLLTAQCTKKQYWIGAQRIGRNFEWITGENWTYDNWDYGQPDQSPQNSNTEDYVQIYNEPNPVRYPHSMRFGWNDMSNNNIFPGEESFFCLDNVGFIIEYETGTTSVRYFREWDAENQIAYFNDDTFIGCQVTDETDLSFLANVDSLVGKYVLVESLPREDGMIAPDTLLSIYAVETKTGTVTAADDDAHTITIDGVLFETNLPDWYFEYFRLSDYTDRFVVYHTYDDAIVGIEKLTTEEGRLVYWNKETNKIQIDYGEDTYRLSEAADADTIALLGDTGYFEFKVKYVVDNNSFIYHIERLPEINITDGNVMMAYFDRRNLSIQCDEEMKCVCVFYCDGIPVEDWSKPVITISNENVLTVTACEKTSKGYRLTIRGIKPGKATIIVTDADTGAYVDFDIEVREEGVVTYSYLFDEVPSFYPNVICDKDTQTNFYNCNGLYVNGFQGGSTFDGIYKFNFTVYNSTNMYGSVDVYDEHGNWYSSKRIDKHTSITGLLDTAESAYFLLYDGLSRDLLSYTAHSYSTPTEIEITVPAGGYFTISNNFLESYGAYLYNMVDFMMIGVDMLLDKAFSSADVEAVQKQTVNQILQTPEANKIFLAGFKDAAQSMIADIAKQGYSDAIESMTLNAFGLFEEMEFDFMDAVNIACGLGENIVEDLFTKCIPPLIGETLRSMFNINKYLDRIYQVKDVFVSVDQPYIRIYTPEATGGLTVSGVTVQPEEGVLPDNAVLQVFRIANTEAMIISDEGLVADQYDLYNICFTANNVEVQPTGNVTVKIPVPSYFNSDKCIVLHQQADGSWRTVKSRIEDGFIVFEVDHFCQFAIVDTTVHGDTDGSGKVNMRDIALIQQYLNGKDVSIDLTVADVDASGMINMRDAALIQQYLNGKDVELK